MRLILFVCLFSLTSLHSIVWSPNPPGNVNSTIDPNGFVTCARSPNPNQFIACFPAGAAFSGDISANFPPPPYYCLYNVGPNTWGDPNQIPLSDSTHNSIFCTYGNGINMITNIDTIALVPTVQFTTFDGAIFGASGPVGGGGTPFANIAYSSYNDPSTTFLVTWLDNGGLPFFSYTSNNGGSWTTAGPVPFSPPGDFFNSFPRVYSVASTLNSDFMITWGAEFTDMSPQGYYSIGTPSTLSSGAQISTSSSVGANIIPSFDPHLNQYIVTWVQGGTGAHVPTYTIYDVTSSTWTTPPTPIPLAGTAVATDAVTSSLDSTTNTLLFTWTDLGTLAPYYVTYDSSLGSPWGTPTPIPGGSTKEPLTPIISTYDPSSLLFMLTWYGNDTSLMQAPAAGATGPLGNYVTASLIQTTTTTVTTSPNPSKWNQTVTLTAHVTGITGNPTGTVTFYVNGVKVGKGTVNPLTGIATLDVSIGCEGDSTVEGVYSGDSLFLGSSGSAVHTVECFFQ